jgi:hypothetical protein
VALLRLGLGVASAGAVFSSTGAGGIALTGVAALLCVDWCGGIASTVAALTGAGGIASTVAASTGAGGIAWNGAGCCGAALRGWLLFLLPPGLLFLLRLGMAASTGSWPFP